MESGSELPGYCCLDLGVFTKCLMAIRGRSGALRDGNPKLILKAYSSHGWQESIELPRRVSFAYEGLGASRLSRIASNYVHKLLVSDLGTSLTISWPRHCGVVARAMWAIAPRSRLGRSHVRILSMRINAPRRHPQQAALPVLAGYPHRCSGTELPHNAAPDRQP